MFCLKGTCKIVSSFVSVMVLFNIVAKYGDVALKSLVRILTTCFKVNADQHFKNVREI